MSCDIAVHQRIERSRESAQLVTSSTPCVHHLFESQAALCAEQAAVSFDGNTLNYKELNAKSSAIAATLIQKGVAPGDKVAICLPRSVEMIAVVIGVLKAGGVYVPIDPSYPQDRISYILSDSSASLVISSHAMQARLPRTDNPLWILEQALAENTLAGSASSFDFPALEPSSPAYLIYTSGSTGRPKGVLMPHAALVNLIRWQNQNIKWRGSKKALQFSPLSFDVSFQEIFTTLTSGGELILIDEQTRIDPPALLEYLGRHQIERLFLPYVMLNSLSSAAMAVDIAPASLRDIVTAGEALIVTESIRTWFSNLNACLLHNHYGPSETHVVTSHVLGGDAQSWPASPPIGVPLDGVDVYLVRENATLVGRGETGEICIGGAQLAIGYHQLPEQTQSKFVRIETASGEWVKVYKTGDIGQWNPDGTLKCLGRNDHQAKIRGFRVELSEIEEVLMRVPGIAEAAVVIQANAAQQIHLAAFVLAKVQDREACKKLAYAKVRETLPDYMVPNSLVVMETLPLTASGKIDRKALMEWKLAGNDQEPTQCLEGECEELIATIWRAVLGIENLNKNSHFINLGGHSVKAMEITSSLIAHGYKVSVHDIISRPRLSDIALWLSEHAERVTCGSVREVVDTQEQPVIQEGIDDPDNTRAVLPLNALQQGILYQHLLDEEGDTYVLWQMLSFNSRHLLDRYLDALQNAINRHDALRTKICYGQGDEAVQVICKRATLVPEWVEFDLPPGEVAPALYAHCNPSKSRLDLTTAPLQRVTCARDGDRWVMLHVFHHIVTDHVSLEQLEQEIELELLGRSQDIPPAISYLNCALPEPDPATVDNYFSRVFSGFESAQAPFGMTQALSVADEVKDVFIRLDPELSNKLYEQARQVGISCAAIFHLAWAKVLADFGGQADAVFATVLSGRMGTASGLDRALGLFINTLPIRVNFHQLSVRQSLKLVQEQLLALLKLERASLAQALQSLPESQHPMTMFNYRHSQSEYLLEGDPLGIVHETQVAGMRCSGVVERTNYPLVVSVDDCSDGHLINVQFTADLDGELIFEYFSNALKALSQAMADNLSCNLSSLSIVPQQELAQIERWNSTDVPLQKDLCLHQLIEEQVARSRSATALEYQNTQLSFSELNERANQLAHYLHHELGVSPDVPVGICMHRSVELVVALLAVLKAGGAYVSLDPGYPSKRLSYMLENSAPVVVLTHDLISGDTINVLNKAQTPTLDLSVEPKPWEAYPTSNLSIEATGVTSQHLAYIIYTSGSTGKPKGVMNEHLGVINKLKWMQREYGIGPGDRILQKTPFSFDVSVWEFFLPLLSGARLVLAKPEGHKDPEYLKSLIRESEITALHFVPSMLSLFLEHLEQPIELDKVFCSGEALPLKTVEVFKQRLPGVELHNLYGPTEAAIDVSYWNCTQQNMSDTVPIGAAVDNTQLHILDADLNPCPIGVVGELFIGGVQVARGYLNQPQLTKERFIADHFNTGTANRLYKTGDLVRFRRDGNIEYIGRNDFQVKIRGFRIELEEIENTLRGHSDVKDCVVLAQTLGEGNQRLVAVVLGNEGASTDESGVRDYLHQHLSDFMVPSHLLWVDAFPLTPNGKLDRGELHKILEAYFTENKGLEPPQGEIEVELAEIWTRLLEGGEIGRNSHFYSVGGQSLLAVRLLNQINSKFEIEIGLGQLLQNMDIRSQAELIEVHQRTRQRPLDLDTDDSREIKALATQKAIYKAVKLDPDNIENNSYVALAFESDSTPDARLLKKTLHRVFSLFPVLRSRFSLRDDELFMIPADRLSFRLEKRMTLGSLEADLRDFVRPFTLEDACNVRARLVSGERYYLLLDFSHACVDGIAIKMLLDALSPEGQGEELTPLATYSKHFYGESMLAERQQHLEYWVNHLSGYTGLTEDTLISAKLALTVQISAEEKAAIAEVASKYKVSASELYMMMFLMLKARMSGVDKQLTSIAFHGRNTLAQQDLIAPLMSVLPIHLAMSQRVDRDVISRVSETMREGFCHYLYDASAIAEVAPGISNRVLFPESFFGYVALESERHNIAGATCQQVETPDIFEESRLWNDTCEVVEDEVGAKVSLHFTRLTKVVGGESVEALFREILIETLSA